MEVATCRDARLVWVLARLIANLLPGQQHTPVAMDCDLKSAHKGSPKSVIGRVAQLAEQLTLNQ